jgi:predicted dithiol-disulfide oxidoreductase (DUF899 family)
MSSERRSGGGQRSIDREFDRAGRKSSSQEEKRKKRHEGKGVATMTTATTEKAAAKVKVVSPKDWLAARQQLLKKEREFTRLRDELSRERREMPWEKVEKPYALEGPTGKETLADLFGGKHQLIIYHFMFGPGWKEGCPSCSYLGDSFDGAWIHLAQRDTAFVVVSRATLPEIEAFKKRMGWKFKWVSSFGTDFNYDYHVSFTKDEIANKKATYNYAPSDFPSEEAPGLSVFSKRGGEVFHTYSTFARGLDILLPTYNLLDMTAKGRDEDSLPWPMAWVRHHDKYGDPTALDAITLIAQSGDKK